MAFTIGKEIKDIFRNVNVRSIIHLGSIGTQKEQTYPQRIPAFQFSE